MSNILTDTGFWRALVDVKDQHHTEAIMQMDIITANKHTLLIPWPIMYETLKTKFVKNAIHLLRFKNALEQLKTEFIDDSKWRKSCMEVIFDNHYNNASLVDLILVAMIEDKSIHIDFLITYNERDFSSYYHLLLPSSYK